MQPRRGDRFSALPALHRRNLPENGARSSRVDDLAPLLRGFAWVASGPSTGHAQPFQGALSCGLRDDPGLGLLELVVVEDTNVAAHEGREQPDRLAYPLHVRDDGKSVDLAPMLERELRAVS